MAASIVVPGPGDMNAMNGLKNALNDCVPLHLAVETEREVRGGDGIHETPPETYDTVVKENVLVDSPAGAVPAVAEAIRVAREHPQGPVRVGIPKDVLASRTPQPAIGDREPAAAAGPARGRGRSRGRPPRWSRFAGDSRARRRPARGRERLAPRDRRAPRRPGRHDL